MAEIKIGNAKYVTIDDKTASAESIGWSETTFQKTVKIEGKEYSVTRLGDAYEVKNIPDTVTSIGRLRSCSNISIPDTVISIGRLCFCSNITIPDSVTSIGDMMNCSNMKINFPKGIKSLYPISGLKGITIPDSVTSMGNMNYCSNISIPDSVTSIGEMVSCSNITIPDSVTSIGGIYSCSNISIPDSVTSIGDIEHCSNITIPDSVTFIGNMSECSNITIPDSITMLNGIYRSTLTIPASVTTIKEIDGENGTLFLRMESAIPPALAKATRLAKDDMLIVPKGAAEAYKKHPVWGKFKNISEDPRLNADSVSSPSSDKVSSKQKEKTEPKKDTPKPQPAPAPKQEPKKETPKPQPAPAPKAEPKKEAPKPEVRRPSADDMNVLDKLIDAALEDFVLTDEERSVLLKKSKEIGLGEDEFKLYLNGKIQERMKDKPEEKVEEKKKGFFARLFGR